MNYTIEELIEELQKLQKNAGGWNMPVKVLGPDGKPIPIQKLKAIREEVVIHV